MPKRKPTIPMLPTLGTAPFTTKEWVYEIKWEGYRMIATVSKGKASLHIDGKDCTKQYSVIANELEGQQDMILDGVVAVVDETGRPDITLLHHYSGKEDIAYYVFDLLYLDGESWMEKPLLARKEILLHAIKKVEVVTYSDHFNDGIALYKQVKKMDLPGIVAKRKSSLYLPGTNSKDWVSIPVPDKKIIPKPSPGLPNSYEAVMAEIKRVRELRLAGKGQ